MKRRSAIIMLCMIVAMVIAPVSALLAQEAIVKMTGAMVTKIDLVLLKNVNHIRSEAY
jgi:hypothetical protein